MSVSDPSFDQVQEKNACSPGFLQRHAVSVRLYLIVLCLYFGSEMILRRSVYASAIKVSGANLNTILKKLPALIRDPIKNHLEVQALKASLEASDSPDERSKILFKLTGLVGRWSQQKYYRQIIRECPRSPNTARAWQMLLVRESDDKVVRKKYFDYLQHCSLASREEQRLVWTIGWNLFASRGDEVKFAFLKRLAAAEVVAPDLLRAYNTLEQLAQERDDKKLATRAETLYRKCEKLQLEILNGKPSGRKK